ncbi:hypothetical protein AA313_de0209628 [Arthrobotrys entomopaga]|nr:hypothetical protein AA313_de0209628 [Arthrobotrys entomopaga]
MQLKSLLFTSLLAATTATALPTSASPEVDLNIATRALCTPQDNTGFTVRINSTDSLHDKILSISGSTVGVDLPTVDSVIWPYSDGNKLFMPGPGYKYLIPGYLYSNPSSRAATKQLKFSQDLPTVGTAETGVFSTSCDIMGQFYLAVGGDWSWKACPVEGGAGWTIHKVGGEGCRDVKLRMTYGPPY